MNLPKHHKIAQALTDRLFLDMQDPSYQGRAFTWEGFSDLAQRLVEAELFIHYAKLPQDFDDIKAQAGQHAFEYATKLVEDNRDSLVVYAKKTPGP